MHALPTWFLNIPANDDPDPEERTPPGDRWCSLWGPREPGGPRLPCHPSIEGTADEWLLIAGAIEAGAPRAFDRVAFYPTEGGGTFRSPRNSTGERDHVHLTAAELEELVAYIRAELAAVPVHPMAEDGSGPTTGARPTIEPATADGIFAALGEMAPAGRPPGVPTSAPAKPTLHDVVGVARAIVACDGDALDTADEVNGAEVLRLARAVVAHVEAQPGGQRFDLPDAVAELAIDRSTPPTVTPVTGGFSIGYQVEAVPIPTPPTFDINGDVNGPACDCEPGKLDPECIHQAEQDARDADAIVRVLHRGFLPALRAAIDRAAPSPGIERPLPAEASALTALRLQIDRRARLLHELGGIASARDVASQLRADLAAVPTTPADPVEEVRACRDVADWARSLALTAINQLERLLRDADCVPVDLLRGRIESLRARLGAGPEDAPPAGAIVQVVAPAGDGTAANVGMLGVVADGPGPAIPDAGGVHVHFQWHDRSLQGSIARKRLRIVGVTDFLPAPEDLAAPGVVVTIADPAELREVYREAVDVARAALDEFGALFARFNTLRASAGLALDGGQPTVIGLRERLDALTAQVQPGLGAVPAGHATAAAGGR
jgi:hypothetical protein